MSEVSATVNAPKAPQVNLLPPEVAARRKQGRTRVWIIIGLILFMMMLVGVWFLAFGARVTAELDRDLAVEQGADLRAELAEYDYLPEIEASLENSQLARFWAGSTDVIWADYVASFIGALPEDVVLENYQFTGNTPNGGAPDDGTVFATPDIGALTFAAESEEPVFAADLIEAINALPGFHRTQVTVTQLEANEDTDTVWWTIAGSTRVTAQALSGRVETEQTELPPGFEIELGPDADTEADELDGGSEQ